MSMNINIDGGLATIEYKQGRSKIKKQVTLERLVATLADKTLTSTQLLPPFVRQVVTRRDETTVVCEFPPSQRHIVFKNDSGKTVVSGMVAVPAFIFRYTYIKRSDGRMGMRASSIHALKEPLKSLDDLLYRFPFSNVHDDGGICWGSISQHELTIQSYYEIPSIVDKFFAANFNKDLSPNFDKHHKRYEDVLREIKDKVEYPIEYLYGAIPFRDLR